MPVHRIGSVNFVYKEIRNICFSFVSYKSSTLEKNFKYELLTEPDLNVKIDLINPSTYQIDPHEKPQIHPIDEQLLEDESISQLNSKRFERRIRGRRGEIWW